MTQTEFLGLTKRDPTDKYSREQNNENLDRIDTFAEAVSKGILGIPTEATGTTIVLTDASENNLKNLVIYGNASLEIENPTVKVIGKNLLENEAKSSATEGITITVNDDKSVTVKGTPTSNAGMFLNSNLTLPIGNYVLSGGGTSGSVKLIIRITESDGSYTYVVNTGKETRFSVTAENVDLPRAAYIYILEGNEAVDTIIYPMIRLVSISDDTYEPYKFQTLEVPYTLNEGDYVDYEKGVVYRAETQTETPLTTEEMEAFKALHTYYPTTTITNSEGDEMSVTYYADTKLYLDNKFGEIQNAILSLGANV